MHHWQGVDSWIESRIALLLLVGSRRCFCAGLQLPGGLPALKPAMLLALAPTLLAPTLLAPTLP